MNYPTTLLAHYRTPSHRGLPEGPGEDRGTDSAAQTGREPTWQVRTGEARNVLCGDVVVFGVRLDGGRITTAGFEGSGCILTLGLADLLAEAVTGRTVAEAQAITETDVLRWLEGTPVPAARRTCTRLAWQAMHEALDAA